MNSLGCRLHAMAMHVHSSFPASCAHQLLQLLLLVIFCTIPVGVLQLLDLHSHKPRHTETTPCWQMINP
jgi:hypothetical protein